MFPSSRPVALMLWILVALAGVLFAGIAVAADTIPAHAVGVAISPAPAALSSFLERAFPVMTAFLMGLLTLFTKWWNQRHQLQLSMDRNGFLFKLAAQGIALAEEQAARLAGSRSALTGNQKLDIAVAHILDAFPRISEEQAQKIVHSVLAQIPGAGATREAVTLLPGEGGYSIPLEGEIVTLKDLTEAQPSAAATA